MKRKSTHGAQTKVEKYKKKERKNPSTSINRLKYTLDENDEVDLSEKDSDKVLNTARLNNQSHHKEKPKEKIHFRKDKDRDRTENSEKDINSIETLILSLILVVFSFLIIC